MKKRPFNLDAGPLGAGGGGGGWMKPRGVLSTVTEAKPPAWAQSKIKLREQARREAAEAADAARPRPSAAQSYEAFRIKNKLKK